MVSLPLIAHDPPVRVMALHALAYCRRLFYLEEVEEIRVADERVFAGRQLHAALEAEEDGENVSLDLSSSTLGLSWQGRLPAPPGRASPSPLRAQSRGQRRAAMADNTPVPPGLRDRLQLIAYAVLLEEACSANPSPKAG